MAGNRDRIDSQHFWQNGIPGDADTEEGFMYRRINAAYDLNHPDNAFVAAGLSSNQLLALKGKHDTQLQSDCGFHVPSR